MEKFKIDQTFHFLILEVQYVHPTGTKHGLKLRKIYIIFRIFKKNYSTLNHFLCLLGAHTALLTSKNEKFEHFWIFPCMFIFFLRLLVSFLRVLEGHTKNLKKCDFRALLDFTCLCVISGMFFWPPPFFFDKEFSFK